MRLLKTILSILLIFLISFGTLSCKGPRKSSCMDAWTYKKYHKKSGHPKYSSTYKQKSSPVRKDYVIKNKRRR